MNFKRFIAPLIAGLGLAVASVPAQAAPVNFVITAISGTLSFSGPQGGNLTHSVTPPGGDGLEASEFISGNGGLPAPTGVSSTFSIGSLVYDYDGSTAFSPGSFSFFIQNDNAREFFNASYHLAIEFLFPDSGDFFNVDLDFANLGDLNFLEQFTAEFLLADEALLDSTGQPDPSQVEVGFAGSGLWLSGLVPAALTDTIGGVPGGGTDVPEPGSLALLGLGLLGLGAARRVRSRH